MANNKNVCFEILIEFIDVAIVQSIHIKAIIINAIIPFLSPALVISVYLKYSFAII